MRRSHLLPLLFALLCAKTLACADPDAEDAGTDGGTTTQDSGPRADSGTPDSGPRADAGTPDAGSAPDADMADTGTPDSGDVDAGTADSGTDAGVSGLVRVIFDTQVSGTPVVFHDPSGAVIQTVTTSVGEASAQVPSGGMVTFQALIFTGKGGTDTLNTIVGVEPGDIYNVHAYGPPVTYLGDAEITLPGPYAGAFDYYLNFGCYEFSAGDPSTPSVYSIFSDCVGTSTTVGVLAIARDVNNVPLAYSALDPLTLTSSTVLTTATLGPWTTITANYDVTVTNPPANAVDVDIQRYVLRAGSLYDRGFGFIDLSGGTGGTAPIALANFGDGNQALLQLDLATGISALLSRAPGRTPLAVDLSTTMMPLVDTASVVQTGDPERPDVRWTPVAAQADGALLQVHVYDPYYNWNFIVPPGAIAQTLPELPVEFARYLPIASTVYDVGFALFDASFVTDYRTFRLGVAVGLIEPNRPSESTLPVPSVIRWSNYQANF